MSYIRAHSAPVLVIRATDVLDRGECSLGIIGTRYSKVLRGGGCGDTGIGVSLKGGHHPSIDFAVLKKVVVGCRSLTLLMS